MRPCCGSVYASIVDSRLDACLFLAPSRASLPGREKLAAALGTQIEGTARTGLLAGDAADAAVCADPGPIVCACFAVGLRVLRRALAEERVKTLAEIGAALRAGTNCGSCIPELNAILRAARAEATA
jgi:assimilatory nitrate reductase catalytic subunit